MSGISGGSGGRQGGRFGLGNRGGGRSSGGGNDRRWDRARGRYNGYGSSIAFNSSSASITEHAEVTVVAGKRQVTPSLVNVASSAERLSKLSVTGDRVKPVSSNSAHDLAAAIATAVSVADA